MVLLIDAVNKLVCKAKADAYVTKHGFIVCQVVIIWPNKEVGLFIGGSYGIVW